MKQSPRALLPMLLLLLIPTIACAQKDRTETLRSDGIERTYTIHIPEGLPPGAPLVIVLHG